MDDSSSTKTLLGGGNFSFRLENYLRLNRASKKTLYADVPDTLSEKDEATHTQLANSSVATLSNYSGYVTLLGYDKRARFVNGVSDAVDTANKILQAQNNLDNPDSGSEKPPSV